MTGLSAAALHHLLANDFHAGADAVRAAGGIAPGPPGTWYVTDHDVITSLLRDATLSAYPGRAATAQLDAAGQAAADRVEAFFDLWPVFSDGEHHRSVRSALAPAYTRTAVADARDSARCAAARLLAGPAAPAEMYHGFALPLAVEVACAGLGIPDAQRDQVLEWSDALLAYLGSDEADAAVVAAADAAVAGLSGTVEQRCAAAGPAAPPAVRHLAALPPAAATAMFAQLLTGAIEPVAVTLGAVLENALVPGTGHLDRVARGEVDAADVAREAARWATPFRFVVRTTTASARVLGTDLPTGSRLVLLLGAATSDPGLVPSPRELLLGSRTPAQLGLAFGAGPHHCLGAALAVQVVAGAVQALAEWSGRARIRAVRVVPGVALGLAGYDKICIEQAA